jgi:hypothetical protein
MGRRQIYIFSPHCQVFLFMLFIDADNEGIEMYYFSSFQKEIK